MRTSHPQHLKSPARRRFFVGTVAAAFVASTAKAAEAARPEPAKGREQSLSDEMTHHRRAYYRRARF